MVEYAVLLSLIALALVGPVFGLGQQVGNRFQSITNTLTNGGGGSGLPGGGGDGGEITPPPTTPDPETPTTPDPETPTTPDPETPTTPDPEPETGATVDPSKTPLKDVTWEELDKLSPDAAKDPDKYKDWVGQELSDGKNTWILVGVGQDVGEDGNKLGFTFMSKDVLSYHYMNYSSSSEGTSEGGWARSDMYAYVNDELGPTLPIDKFVKQASKEYAPDRTRPEYLKTAASKYWIPSAVEIYGTEGKDTLGGQAPTENEQYEFFKGLGVTWLDTKGAAANGYFPNADGFYGPQGYWLRSVVGDYGYSFWAVRSQSGSSDRDNYSKYNNGVRLGICI